MHQITSLVGKYGGLAYIIRVETIDVQATPVDEDPQIPQLISRLSLTPHFVNAIFVVLTYINNASKTPTTKNMHLSHVFYFCRPFFTELTSEYDICRLFGRRTHHKWSSLVKFIRVMRIYVEISSNMYLSGPVKLLKYME